HQWQTGGPILMAKPAPKWSLPPGSRHTTGLSTLGFDPARFQTKPPACYRASSWQLPGPDSHRHATTSFRPSHDRKTITSRSLGAPAAELRRIAALTRDSRRDRKST